MILKDIEVPSWFNLYLIWFSVELSLKSRSWIIDDFELINPY